MLPEPYRLALQALKDQATAVNQPLTDPSADEVACKAKLADAQRRMAAHETEMRHIVRVVMNAKSLVTIPELTESRLAEMLDLTSPAN